MNNKEKKPNNQMLLFKGWVETSYTENSMLIERSEGLYSKLSEKMSE